MVQHKQLKDGFTILSVITFVLLAKEIISASVQFGQKVLWKNLEFISVEIYQKVVEKILTYKMAFYTSAENESGKLQTRIDSGISSLTRLVQNFFIDILPLFANALIALGIMFYANFYIGLVSLCIVPIYFLLVKNKHKN